MCDHGSGIGQEKVADCEVIALGGGACLIPLFIGVVMSPLLVLDRRAAVEECCIVHWTLLLLGSQHTGTRRAAYEELTEAQIRSHQNRAQAA